MEEQCIMLGGICNKLGWLAVFSRKSRNLQEIKLFAKNIRGNFGTYLPCVKSRTLN